MISIDWVPDDKYHTLLLGEKSRDAILSGGQHLDLQVCSSSVVNHRIIVFHYGQYWTLPFKINNPRLFNLLSIEDSTGCHRLIEHSEHSPTDVGGQHLTQKIETVLTLLVEGSIVLHPVQSLDRMKNTDSQIFDVLYNVHTDPLRWKLGSPASDFRFIDPWLKVLDSVSSTPLHSHLLAV